MIQTRLDRKTVAVLVVIVTAFWLLSLAGCAVPEKQVAVDTQVIQKPVPVRVSIERPKECPAQYPLDTLQPGATPVQIWRAAEAELEMRAACILKLLAALTGSSDGR